MSGTNLGAQMLAALRLQMEFGADEAILDTSVDRFAAPEAAAARPPAAPAQAPAPSEEPAGAAALAARARTLGELAEAMRGWEGSDLRLGARNFVFADGRAGARLMIVGEAPGSEEDRQGKPFVGRAGQLLDRMLAAIGLSRHAEDPDRAAYIANILPWRPPGNRTPSEREVAAFLPFVERHIVLAAPQIVMTVGNTPTRALLGTATGIKRMRGTWHRHAASGAALIPSFHPAYLLRQPSEKRLSWRDLRAVRAKLDGC